MQNIINIIDLGKKDFKETWDIQKILHQKRVNKEIADTLILVEHNPVVTMGKSGKKENIRVPAKLLEAKGIAYYDIERGGDVTFHGPGQLVGYPIFNIKDGLVGIKPFIGKVEEAIIKSLGDFGIKGQKREKMIGVWIDRGKICSIGVAVQRWVSFHGFALNVNTDLTYFDLIVPCGLQNIKMTSMMEIIGKEIPVEDVKKSIKKSIGRVFNRTIKDSCLKEII